ncbi:MAG: hypothetical protein GY705_15460 [Bacteroidetes bacterium]|nr:hypothetical protein [Bacteroidota bacterium]
MRCKKTFILVLFALTFAYAQSGFATTDRANDKSAQEIKAKELKDKEYVRLKIKFGEGKIANRVRLLIFCKKFQNPIPISTFSDPTSSDKELKKLKNETNNRVSSCLEELPENSFIIDSYPDNCGGTDCFITGRATEAGLDFIAGDQDLSLEEDVPHSAIPEVPLPESIKEKLRFHHNPPVNIESTISDIKKYLPSKQDITISGHYRSKETVRKFTKEKMDFSKVFPASASKKVQVAVECNRDHFYPPLSHTPGVLYQKINGRRKSIMRDVPPNAQGRYFKILKPTSTSSCAFVVKVDEVGVENLLNDKRVTGLYFVEGELSADTVLPFSDQFFLKKR